MRESDTLGLTPEESEESRVSYAVLRKVSESDKVAFNCATRSRTSVYPEVVTGPAPGLPGLPALKNCSRARETTVSVTPASVTRHSANVRVSGALLLRAVWQG